MSDLDDYYHDAGYVKCACGAGLWINPNGNGWLSPGPECERHTAVRCYVDRDAVLKQNRLRVLCEWAAHSLAKATGFDHITDDERKLFGTEDMYLSVVELIRHHAEDTWQAWLPDDPIVGYFDPPCDNDPQHDSGECNHCGHLRCPDCAGDHAEDRTYPARLSDLMVGDTCFACEKPLRT